MTFSTVVKNEISKLESNKLEDISELSSIVRNSADINNEIKIVIENNAIARRIYSKFRDIYEVTPNITVRERIHFSRGFIIRINNKVNDILDDLSIFDNGRYLDIPKDYIVNDEEQIRAYLRGLFITCGSVNDPKTSRYHLEFIVNSKNYAYYVCNLLNSFNLNSKVIKREKNYMIYIKEAEKISDFLRIIKAYSAVMYYEDIRIYRDHKNMTNRLNNCEQANVDKIFMSANSQLKDIEKIKAHDLDDLLDEKIREVMEYRIKYPESSLQELSDIISRETGNKITKSGLNHRFRKIKEFAANIK